MITLSVEGELCPLAIFGYELGFEFCSVYTQFFVLTGVGKSGYIGKKIAATVTFTVKNDTKAEQKVFLDDLKFIRAK